MDKTMIIPDIHTDFSTAELLIKKEEPDRIIFLGDYFDAHDETEQDTNETAKWLVKSLQKDNRIHLIGNHDLSYMTMNPRLKCSGFSEHKKFIIDKYNIPWEQLRPYCFVGNYLCTHAGVSKQFFEQYAKTGIIEFMLESDDELEHIDDIFYSYKFFQIGRSRGGTAENGGILWCDYGEFTDIPGIMQIFGHTPADEVRQEKFHTCLDTGLRYYAVCKNNEIIIKAAK